MKTPTKRRRQYRSGSVFQACSAGAGCPPLEEGPVNEKTGKPTKIRPKHTCKGRWMGTIENGVSRSGDRRRKTVTGKTEAQVKERIRQKLRELDRGVDVSVKGTTVKAWADTWLGITEKKVTPNGHTTDRAAMGWILETIGHRRLDQLTPADVRSVRTAITSAGKSTSTALRYHGTLHRMLVAAQDEGYQISANVLAVKGPTAAVNDRTSMTVDEALAMLQQAALLPHGSRWLCAFLQGVRQGEALGLTLPNIEDGLLRLAWQQQPLPYTVKRDRTSGFRTPDGYESVQMVGQLHLVRPKSRSGYRVLPQVPLLTKSLEHWVEVMPKSPHGLVWPDADGQPRDENDDRAEWYAMQDAAGVRHPSGRHYKVHEARHTTATLLLSLGVDEKTRVQIMGHSSHASTTLYEHVDLKMIRKALTKVAKQLDV